MSHPSFRLCFEIEVAYVLRLHEPQFLLAVLVGFIPIHDTEPNCSMGCDNIFIILEIDMWNVQIRHSLSNVDTTLRSPILHRKIKLIGIPLLSLLP